jgi:hypothetical protein
MLDVLASELLASPFSRAIVANRRLSPRGRTLHENFKQCNLLCTIQQHRFNPWAHSNGKQVRRMLRHSPILGWPGLEDAGPKPRGFLRPARSRPGPRPVFDRFSNLKATVNTSTSLAKTAYWCIIRAIHSSAELFGEQRERTYTIVRRTSLCVVALDEPGVSSYGKFSAAARPK